MFVLTDNGGFDVTPEGLLTQNVRVFLLENREEARLLVRYQADDSHLADVIAPGASIFAQE